ncbi:MAG: hypothetical protein CM1200mP39_28880 [Dehalococcoidia bacterium]|nr:MAG: hypothetical protein CM1200mP39_28880 [Dehalococcoidia bacterium]
MSVNPSDVRNLFESHYFLFAFLSSLGTLQIAVTGSGIRALWLTPYRRVTRWLGFVCIITGVLFFFGQPLFVDGPWAAGSVQANSTTREWGLASWGELAGARNVNDIHGGLDGVDQAIWFSLAVIFSFAVSVVFGALSIKAITKGLKVDAKSDDTDGLAGLVHRSYFSNLRFLTKFSLGSAEVLEGRC